MTPHTVDEIAAASLAAGLLLDLLVLRTVVRYVRRRRATRATS